MCYEQHSCHIWDWNIKYQQLLCSMYIGLWGLVLTIYMVITQWSEHYQLKMGGPWFNSQWPPAFHSPSLSLITMLISCWGIYINVVVTKSMLFQLNVGHKDATVSYKCCLWHVLHLHYLPQSTHTYTATYTCTHQLCTLHTQSTLWSTGITWSWVQWSLPCVW